VLSAYAVFESLVQEKLFASKKMGGNSANVVFGEKFTAIVNPQSSRL
jgi:hypothetical protein